jgi:hypothetical protein
VRERNLYSKKNNKRVGEGSEAYGFGGWALRSHVRLTLAHANENKIKKKKEKTLAREDTSDKT